MTYQTWHFTCEIWRVTCFMSNIASVLWNVTCQMGYMTLLTLFHYSFNSCSSLFQQSLTPLWPILYNISLFVHTHCTTLLILSQTTLWHLISINQSTYINKANTNENFQTIESDHTFSQKNRTLNKVSSTISHVSHVLFKY